VARTTNRLLRARRAFRLRNVTRLVAERVSDASWRVFRRDLADRIVGASVQVSGTSIRVAGLGGVLVYGLEGPTGDQRVDAQTVTCAENP
jgi:hypothetical protein